MDTPGYTVAGDITHGQGQTTSDRGGGILAAAVRGQIKETTK